MRAFESFILTAAGRFFWSLRAISYRCNELKSNKFALNISVGNITLWAGQEASVSLEPIIMSFKFF